MNHRSVRFLALFIVVVLLGASHVWSAATLEQRRSGRLWSAPPVELERLRDEARVHAALDGLARIGRRTQTSLTPETSGVWEIARDGGRTWRLNLEAAGALWTVVAFTQFEIPEGASVRLLASDGTEAFGPYGSDAAPTGQLWVPPVPDSRVTVELDWPERLGDPVAGLRIGAVSHGFLPWYPDLEDPVESSSDAGSCNVDVNCPLGTDWQDEKRGVVKLLIGGTTICSGALVNNTSLDCTPYVLTANHCYENGEPVSSTLFQFFFERPMCGAGPFTSEVATGAFLEANETLSLSDFRLLRIAEPAPAGAYFNGWNRATTPASEVWGLHHPNQTNSGVMQICHRAAPVIEGIFDHWEVTKWDEGFVAAGSSGSPLFDAAGRIVGQLDTGFPGDNGVGVCPPQDVEAQYGKLAVAWPDGLSAKLAPTGSPISLHGMDEAFCGAPAPRLNLRAAEIVGGNGDGVADPGETVAVRIELFNDGPVTATSAVAVAQSPNPDVALLKNSVSWGGIQIQPGSVSEGPSMFELKLLPAFTCGSSVELTLNIAWFSPLLQTQSKVLLQTGTRVGLAGDPVFLDDIESGAGTVWATEQAVGSNPWFLSTAEASSGVQSWHVQDVSGATDSRLVLDPGVGPLPQAAVLRFTHRFDSEIGADGGVLELSRNGGPWEDAGPRITEGGYNGAIAAGFGSPIAGSAAWTGSIPAFAPVEVDLAGLAGDTVRFRWRFATDSIGGGLGWYVDDVTIDTAVYDCVTPQPGAACDGFRAGAFECGAPRPGRRLDFPRQRPAGR